MNYSKLLVNGWMTVYRDFIKPSRLGEFRRFLELAVENGYGGVSVRDAFAALCHKEMSPRDRLLILRHDVDSDPATAKKMWRIEAELGLHATYYFRLSTVDFEFMKELEASGSEASYHYEELAVIAKGFKLEDPEAIAACIPAVRHLLKLNLESLRRKTGLPMRTIASHGDFINVRLGISNTKLLESISLRQDLGIELEAYDEALMKCVNLYASDIHGTFVRDLTAGIEAHLPVICVLTHPRNWQVNWRENCRMIGERVAEAACFALKRNLAQSR